MKACFKYMTVLLVCAGLTACSSTQFLGYAQVEQEQFLKKPDPQKVARDAAVAGTGGAATGAAAGATAGTVTGAATGAAVGAVCMVMTAGLCAPVAVGMVAAGAGAGAAGGAAVGAGIGLLAGGVGGYVYGVRQQGLGLFHYVVKPEFQKSLLKFRQYSQKHMRKGSRVKVYSTKYKGHEVYHIEPAK